MFKFLLPSISIYSINCISKLPFLYLLVTVSYYRKWSQMTLWMLNMWWKQLFVTFCMISSSNKTSSIQSSWSKSNVHKSTVSRSVNKMNLVFREYLHINNVPFSSHWIVKIVLLNRFVSWNIIETQENLILLNTSDQICAWTWSCKVWWKWGKHQHSI